MIYPTIRISGEPEQRGRQYGELARERVHRSVALYARLMEKRAGWGWADTTARVRPFLKAIEEQTDYLPELAGIAAGADVELLDIVALNSRTELVALANRETHRHDKADGCTAFGLGANGPRESVLIGQTWDWLTPTVGTVVVLEVRREDGPNYVTVVEAGLAAKAGLNSAGLAICTNFLVTSHDGTRPGLPYHLTLRALFDQETLPEALASLNGYSRASSANYLLAHEDGGTVDIEVVPGGHEAVHVHQTTGGVITHANHFVAVVAGDTSILTSPDSPFRHSRIDALLASPGSGLGRSELQSVLSDHANFPRSICAHSDLRVVEHEREVTAYGLIMEPSARRMHLADGNPCTAEWRELDVSDVLTDTRASRETIAPAIRA